MKVFNSHKQEKHPREIYLPLNRIYAINVVGWIGSRLWGIGVSIALGNVRRPKPFLGLYQTNCLYRKDDFLVRRDLLYYL